MSKEIQIEITYEIPKLYSSYVAGNMLDDNIVLGKFELNVPDASRHVMIWSFEILPKYRGKGLGRACYGALERLVLEKYDSREIYLELPIPQMFKGEPWNPKGFWEKVGYVTIRGRQMRKTDFKPNG